MAAISMNCYWSIFLVLAFKPIVGLLISFDETSSVGSDIIQSFHIQSFLISFNVPSQNGF